MSRLQSTISKKNNAVQETEEQVSNLRERRNEQGERIPSFNKKGSVNKPGKSKFLKIILVIFGILVALGLIIYIPSFTYKEVSEEVSGDLPFNQEAMTIISKASSADWVEDYDDDGLDNQDEVKFQTDPYYLDSDNDAMSDYAEVYVTKTSPLNPDDTILTNCTLKDELEGHSLSTPYKIGNVIMWADDYMSKAYGSVIETAYGYRFCGFSGFVQFTLYDGWYAYKIENGVHVPLPYRSQENVWHVSAGDEVTLYSQPLEERIRIEMFGNVSFAPVNTFTSLLNQILPEHGWITAKRVTSADVLLESPNVKMADIKPIQYNPEDSSRFSKNRLSMSDIMFVRDAIDRNECVGVTIFHESAGEKVGIIFGYYDDNTFLVADPTTLEYVGNLSITEMARMMMIDSEDTVSFEYFNFSGFGASRSQGFRINFFQ